MNKESKFSLCIPVGPFHFEALSSQVRIRQRIDPEFSGLPGVTQQHIDAVLTGTEEPNDALLAALHLARRANGTYILASEDQRP